MIKFRTDFCRKRDEIDNSILLSRLRGWPEERHVTRDRQTQVAQKPFETEPEVNLRIKNHFETKTAIAVV